MIFAHVINNTNLVVESRDNLRIIGAISGNHVTYDVSSIKVNKREIDNQYIITKELVYMWNLDSPSSFWTETRHPPLQTCSTAASVLDHFMEHYSPSSKPQVVMDSDHDVTIEWVQDGHDQNNSRYSIKKTWTVIVNSKELGTELVETLRKKFPHFNITIEDEEDDESEEELDDEPDKEELDEETNEEELEKEPYEDSDEEESDKEDGKPTFDASNLVGMWDLAESSDEDCESDEEIEPDHETFNVLPWDQETLPSTDQALKTLVYYVPKNFMPEGIVTRRNHQKARDLFVDQTRMFLTLCERGRGSSNKAAVVRHLFSMFEKNLWFLEEYPRFRQKVQDKILQFEKEDGPSKEYSNKVAADFSWLKEYPFQQPKV